MDLGAANPTNSCEKYLHKRSESTLGVTFVVRNDMHHAKQVFRRDSIPQDVVFHDEERTTNHAEMHNVYGHYIAVRTLRDCRNFPISMRFVMSHIAAYAGTQKIYDIHEPGDNQSLWSHLQMDIIRKLCNLGMSGFAFAGTDIGGFGADTTPELLTRWIEAAVFSPLFRNHSCQGTRRQEPWQFDDQEWWESIENM